MGGEISVHYYNRGCSGVKIRSEIKSFHLHGVDAKGDVVIKKKLKRKALLSFIANLPQCAIGIEACGGSHYWCRKFTEPGYDVRIMAPRFVKPYVSRRLSENRLPYRQLLLRCSSSCIHAVVRWQQIGLKIRFCSANNPAIHLTKPNFYPQFSAVLATGAPRRALFSDSLLARIFHKLPRISRGTLSL